MSWLDRQSFLGPRSECILDGATIGIVGLGGGGSHVAQQLAHVGIGSFILADPDIIEDTNLNRLVGGTRADVEAALPKVHIAERLIKGIQPSARVKHFQSNWQLKSDLFKLCDVVIGGVDSVRAKDELESFCRRFLIPYIDMGMDVHGKPGDYLIAGQVVLSVPDAPCLRCFGVVTDEALSKEGAAYGAAGGKPQVVWPNGVLASTAVGLAVQLLTPWHSQANSGAYLEYDGNTGVIAPSYRFEIASKRQCPHYSADQRGDALFDVRTISGPDQHESALPIPDESGSLFQALKARWRNWRNM